VANGVASLKDVAKIASVSVPTASRILRRQKLDQFSDDTRNRVWQAAARLRYRPNMLVEGLQTGLTRTIGVMVPPFDSHWSNILYGIHDELIAADNAPLVLWVKHRQEDNSQHTSDGLEQVHRLIDRRVDGVILWPPFTAAYYEHLEELSARNLPVVTIDHELPATYGADSVTTDEKLGATIVAKHLLELGHRHVGHMADTGLHVWSWAQQRWSFFEHEILQVPGTTCVTLERQEVDNGVEIARKLLTLEPRPTAVFAATDLMARHVYVAAAQLGLRIPQDLSVIGFADLDFAAMMMPPMTSVRQKPYETGRKAARLVLDRIQGKFADAHCRNVKMGCELVLRQSTASPQK
jgi:LacI family transcriptional regulator